MKALAEAAARVCADDGDERTSGNELYGLALERLPRALLLAYAEPLLTPQPEPPAPPNWQPRVVSICTQTTRFTRARNAARRSLRRTPG